MLEFIRRTPANVALLVSALLLSYVTPVKAAAQSVSYWTFDGAVARYETDLAACRAMVDEDPFYRGWPIQLGGGTASWRECGAVMQTHTAYFAKNIKKYSESCIEGILSPTECYGHPVTCDASETLDPDAVLCNANSQKGVPTESCPVVGNPINFTTGNKFQVETDYDGPGPLDFSRTYNSQDGLWRHGYSARLKVGSTRLVVVMSDGREAFFQLDGSLASALPGERGRLRKTGDHWIYSTLGNSYWVFDSVGRLIEQGRSGSEKLQLSYSGSQVAVTDVFGNSLSFTEDAQHQPVSLILGGSILATYSYNESGELSSLNKNFNGQGAQRIFHYEDSRNSRLLTGITDERGIRFASWSYDAQGRAISSEHANGAEKVQVAYDGSAAVITNALGKKASYDFYVSQGVKRIGSVSGAVSANCSASNSTLNYGNKGLLLSRKDNRGNTTVFRYNARDLEISRTTASGTPVAYTVVTEWHSDLYLPIKTVQPGLETRNTYDDEGRLLSRTQVDTSVVGQSLTRAWRYSYDSNGLLLSVDGPRTDVADITTYSYNAQGFLNKVTNAMGHVTQLDDFDSRGAPQKITDGNGLVTTLTYHSEGWLSSSSVEGTTTSFEYDAVGQITRVTRGDGSWLSYGWDSARRLTSVSNNLGERIEYDLDAMGNRKAQRVLDSSSNIVRQKKWIYDELGRLLSAIGAAGQAAVYEYDVNNNITTIKNPRAFYTQQKFDALDRLVSSDSTGYKAQFYYTTQGDLGWVSDPRGVTTAYQYDGLGNLIKRVSPDSGATSYSYDAAGNVIGKTDARGIVTTYTYDALNRLTGRQYASDSAFNVQYYYDMIAEANRGVGLLTAVQDTSGIIGYRYSGNGKLVEQIRSLFVNGVDQYDSVHYAYDKSDNLIRMDYPLGISVNYNRDLAGRVSSVDLASGFALPESFVSGVTYMPFGPIKTLAWANGLALNQAYDQDYRLLLSELGSKKSYYYYDANGNISQRKGDFVDTSWIDYEYSAQDQLQRERTRVKQRDYSYDSAGNRISFTQGLIRNGDVNNVWLESNTGYTYATTSNRLTKINAQAVTTDAAGNLTRDRANRELVYDVQNRLVAVKLAGNIVAEFRYNAIGQRTHKIGAQGTTTFLYGSDGQLLGEQLFNSQGSKVSAQYYVWLDSMPLGGVSITFDAQGAIASRTPFYLHSDHLNTPRMATNQAMQSVWQWQSDAFGVGDATGSLTMNLRFPGQYYDQESGLHYNYFRDYDPQTGRYVESDPIGLKGGLNTYGYVYGNPLVNSDPLGLESISEWSDKAEAEAQSSGLPGEHNGPQDAYRHCVASCMIASSNWGETTSRVAGWANETSNIGQAPGERAMDDWNNQAGICAAKDNNSPEDCPKRCMTLLQNGSLSTGASSDGAYY